MRGRNPPTGRGSRRSQRSTVVGGRLEQEEVDLPSRGHRGQQVEEVTRRQQAEPEDEEPIGKVELDRPVPHPLE